VHFGGTPERTRTSGLLLRRQALYPLSYGRRLFPANCTSVLGETFHQRLQQFERASEVEFRPARRLPLAGYRGALRCQVFPGGLMSFRDRASEPGRVRLNEEDVAYVMNLLRNATQPVNTQQLIDVLRRHPGQFQTASGFGSDSTDESLG
jgi:hypothetical protein